MTHIIEQRGNFRTQSSQVYNNKAFWFILKLDPLLPLPYVSTVFALA